MKTVFNVSAVQDRDGTVYTSNPVSTMVRKSVKFRRYYYERNCCCIFTNCCFFGRRACCVICKICRKARFKYKI